MLLYIVRHAWAGEYGDSEWPDDRLRPLTDEGQKRFHEFAHLLGKRGVEPAAILTSPLVRCVETARILAEETAARPEVIEHEALAPGSQLDPLLRWVRQQEGRDVAWVGHVPDVGELVAALIGDGPASIRFAKGACSAIHFPGRIARASGELYWHLTAKMLGV